MTDTPAAEPADLPLTRSRSRWERLTGLLFAVLVGVLVVAHTYVAVIDVQSQFKQVAIMENSHRVYESDLADRFDKDASVASFESDPVFSTPEWKTVLDENRKVVATAGALEPRTFGIWWPGLRARAEKVLPTVFDRHEFVMAVGMARGTCHDKALTVDERIVRWKERYGYSVLKDDPYWQAHRQAMLAAMPDIIRAGTKYFCSPEQQKS